MLLVPGNVEKTIHFLIAEATNNMATCFVETAELSCLNRTLFWQGCVTSRRWIWRILPYTDVSENLMRPSSGNILAPRPVCPFCIGFFAVVFSRLSMCLYRGFCLVVMKPWWMYAGLHGVTPQRVVFDRVSDYGKAPASSEWPKHMIEWWLWWD